MKKSRAEKIMILPVLIAVIALFVFFFKGFLVPLFRMELANDLQGARELLLSLGWVGGLAVSLIEALQMVVVFIPAEFIQISAGLSYPFYAAVLLCDLGVCLGASIIFLLVRVFRFNGEPYREIGLSPRGNGRGVQLLMYLLFITPIIPFGAICYYASGKKIRYGRYIVTVATGVIPSIISSNLLGAAGKAFLMNALPLWLLVLIVALLAAGLLALIWLFLDKVYFRGGDGTPDSAAWFLLFRLARLLRKRKQRLTVHAETLRGLEPPFIVLCNHESFYDFYYVSELLAGYRPSYVINSQIISQPFLKRLARKAGMIPKKLFYPDKAALRIARKIKAGYPVVIFAEGRLSVDGRNYPVVENAGALYRRLKVPVVPVRISGAYFANPKWRKRFFKSDITVTAGRVITPAELGALSLAELNARIARALAYNESENPRNRYTQKNRAKGLQNVLYRCADCGALYTTRPAGNALVCTACGRAYPLDERYRFAGAPESIPAYYDRIRELERQTLDTVRLEAAVRVKKFGGRPRVRRERGACTLTRSAFTYSCAQGGGFTIPTEKLSALAFSCNAEFELYYQDTLYYFYPLQNRRQVARWALIIDLLREERNEQEKNAD